MKIKYQLLEDIRDIQIIQLLPEVVEKSVFLLESNLVCSLDALHVACAIKWYAELFVSSDKRRILAAKKAGLSRDMLGLELIKEGQLVWNE